MKVHLIDGLSFSEADRQAWTQRLESDRRLDSPFLRPEFMELTARARDGVEVAVIEQEAHPAAFFAFQREERGVGWPVGGFLPDVQAVIGRLDPAVRFVEVLEKIGLSTLHFDHLIADQEGFAPYVSYVDPAPYMDLQEGFEEYCQARQRAGSSLQKQLKRKARKLEREVGPLHLELQADDRQLLSRLIQWKQLHLRQKGYPDMFRQDWIRNVVESVAGSRNSEFCGLVSALYAGDHIVALHLGVRSGPVLASWIPTYSPEYLGYSAGAVLHYELARVAAQDGVRRIDLGRGMNQLKARLASDSFPQAIGTIDRRPLGRLWTGAWYQTRKVIHTLPGGRRWLKRLRRLRDGTTSS